MQTTWKLKLVSVGWACSSEHPMYIEEFVIKKKPTGLLRELSHTAIEVQKGAGCATQLQLPWLKWPWAGSCTRWAFKVVGTCRLYSSSKDPWQGMRKQLFTTTILLYPCWEHLIVVPQWSEVTVFKQKIVLCQKAVYWAYQKESTVWWNDEAGCGRIWFYTWLGYSFLV